MVKNKLGYSLPFDFVRGQVSPEYDSIFDSIDDCLQLLHSLKIESIELRSVPPNTPPHIVKQASDTISKYGMATTIHGILPQIDSESITMPALSALKADQECIVTIHSYAGFENDNGKYIHDTVNALSQLLDNTKENVVFALEINRAKSLYFDPSVSYEGVINIINLVNSERVGACWDFGHAASNGLNNLINPLPSDEFLSKVIHTHIHDLSPDYITHFPLTYARLPLASFTDLLLKSGYAACFNLEFSLERWEEPHMQKRNNIVKSIEILSTTLNRYIK